MRQLQFKVGRECKGEKVMQFVGAFLVEARSSTESRLSEMARACYLFDN